MVTTVLLNTDNSLKFLHLDLDVVFSLKYSIFMSAILKNLKD